MDSLLRFKQCLLFCSNQKRTFQICRPAKTLAFLICKAALFIWGSWYFPHLIFFFRQIPMAPFLGWNSPSGNVTANFLDVSGTTYQLHAYSLKLQCRIRLLGDPGTQHFDSACDIFYISPVVTTQPFVKSCSATWRVILLLVQLTESGITK